MRGWKIWRSKDSSKIRRKIVLEQSIPGGLLFPMYRLKPTKKMKISIQRIVQDWQAFAGSSGGQ